CSGWWTKGRWAWRWRTRMPCTSAALLVRPLAAEEILGSRLGPAGPDPGIGGASPLRPCPKRLGLLAEVLPGSALEKPRSAQLRLPGEGREAVVYPRRGTEVGEDDRIGPPHPPLSFVDDEDDLHLVALAGRKIRDVVGAGFEGEVEVADAVLALVDAKLGPGVGQTLHGPPHGLGSEIPVRPQGVRIARQSHEGVVVVGGRKRRRPRLGRGRRGQL